MNGNSSKDVWTWQRNERCEKNHSLNNRKKNEKSKLEDQEMEKKN